MRENENDEEEETGRRKFLYNLEQNREMVEGGRERERERERESTDHLGDGGEK